MNLFLLLLIPVLTAAGIFMFPTRQAGRVALAGTGIQVLLSLVLLGMYIQARNTGDTSAFIFQSRIAWFPAFNIEFYTGIDGISLVMILLTAAVVFSSVLVSWKIETMRKEFFILLVLLSASAYGFFISLDLFLMFFFLELAVIPKYLLIGIWGSGNKIYSANKLVLMLMAASALVLVGLLGMYYNSGGGTNSFDMLRIAQSPLPVFIQKVFFPFLFLGFGIFTAIFPFHTWVPDGHSSAPTAASMFLAGISMKLGGYGCLRMAVYLMPDAAREYSWLIVLLSTIAIIYGAFATLMQTDLKYINAYSSVSHCGFVLLGIGMLTPSGISGAVIQMVSHGLMTALFFAAIGMMYQRTHTRQVAGLGGLLKVMPFIVTTFYIAGLCSLGLPGLSGFVAEMQVFVGSWEHPGIYYRIATVLACMSIVVTAVYILRALGQSMLGPFGRSSFSTLEDASWNEKLAAIVLIAGILLIGLAPFWIRSLTDPGTNGIMEQLNRIAALN